MPAKYRFTVPPTAEQGSHAGVCSASKSYPKHKDALWDYNCARQREGLAPLNRMPAGTKYVRIK